MRREAAPTWWSPARIWRPPGAGCRHAPTTPPPTTPISPASDDCRRLGAAIEQVALDGRAVPLDDPRLTSGWHDPEGAWRWTDGDAGLALAGVRVLAFGVAMRGRYWADRRPGRVGRSRYRL